MSGIIESIEKAQLKEHVDQFNVHSPAVERIEVVRKGKVRRAKLNYLRQRVGKSAKVKEIVK